VNSRERGMTKHIVYAVTNERSGSETQSGGRLEAV
jgi:hypothetical protein